MHQPASCFSLCYPFVLLFLDRISDLPASRSLAAGFYCVGGTLDVRPVTPEAGADPARSIARWSPFCEMQRIVLLFHQVE
jgi:hypothetical protein